MTLKIVIFLTLSLFLCRTHGQGTLTTLVTFNGFNGAYPCGTLIEGDDGNLYGTTSDLGTNYTFYDIHSNSVPVGPQFNLGALFQASISPTNEAALTNVIIFGTLYDVPYGSSYSGVVQRQYDGNFYGIAGGGNLPFVFNNYSGQGTSWSLPDSGKATGGLIEGSDGNFYGTATTGGTRTNEFGNFPGYVFKMTFNGELTVLYMFTGGNDGGFPTGSLTQGNDGNFYGTTLLGGWENAGTVFRLTTNGALTTLYSFTGGDDGYCPFAGLVQGTDSNFYGTTAYGGQYYGIAGGYGGGTVFKITTNGILTTLASFSGSNGALPLAALVQGDDGNLYGTTYVGGSGFTLTGVLAGAFQDFEGYISSYTPVANTIADVLSENTYLSAPPIPIGSGTLFKITPSGNLTTAYQFSQSAGAVTNTYQSITYIGYYETNTNFWGGPTNSDGANPCAGLTLGSNGTFYGVTQTGGNFGEGTLYQFVPPAPAPPQLQSPQVNGNSLMFAWTSTVGTRYQLQSASNLRGFWSNCGAALVATSSITTATAQITLANSKEFFRVAVLP